MLKAIFFDAAGTLIRLTKSVGQHYAPGRATAGLELDPTAWIAALSRFGKKCRCVQRSGRRATDDDKGWWRDLVERLLERIPGTLDPLDRDDFFEAAYGHFAEAGVWELYPEVSRF